MKSKIKCKIRISKKIEVCEQFELKILYYNISQIMIKSSNHNYQKSQHFLNQEYEHQAPLDLLYQDYHILLAMAGGDALEFARKTQQPV